ncbi:hypothetical protein CONLIGDRAFT_142956 [Coniochaeta ligniaria NRRL 30616]|uniref:Uncharacterized protein n=1 Tax=Coniochaeta ligniaria NRRL 30616 TaxID=1408157 RepID=A0A1J7IPR8_9PEZI|nr:hypothetical protein CONLIGDRAFT_142956 [Coniochaeta ligniaria NRRL 30616]
MADESPLVRRPARGKVPPERYPSGSRQSKLVSFFAFLLHLLHTVFGIALPFSSTIVRIGTMLSPWYDGIMPSIGLEGLETPGKPRYRS